MWDGKDRRKEEKDQDHDVLTRIDTNLSNFMIQFEKHVDQDTSDFKDLRESLEVLKRYVYIGIGGTIVLEFFFNFLKK